MWAVVTTGTGGLDRLVWREVPRPEPGPGQVRLRVLAAGMNNTEINTRLGWYSSDVTDATESTSDAGHRPDGGWSAATPFPFIQGTDCCGRVDAVGQDVDPDLVGARALVRACMRPNGFEDPETIWMGSDFDGAFAEYVIVPATEVFPIDCDWSDVELATVPCAYGTSENMLHRIGLGAGERVLVTGASGGVGSATVQLARRRGADVVAIAGRAKHEIVAELGADTLLDRGDDPVAALGAESVDAVVDNVAGAGFGSMLRILRRRGRYVSSGAIAGPVVALDMRDMYLKDITLHGTTGWDEPVFPNLIGYIERQEIRPLVARTFPMSNIAEAQTAFADKSYVGNFVLVPPTDLPPC